MRSRRSRLARETRSPTTGHRRTPTGRRTPSSGHIFPFGYISCRDRIRRARGALAPPDPRPAARARETRRRARRAPPDLSARCVEASASPARGRSRSCAGRRPPASLRPGSRPARGGGCVARPLPHALGGSARRPRTTPGGEPMIEGTLVEIDGRPALRFNRRLNHPVERVWRAVSTYHDLAAWFVAPMEFTGAGQEFDAMEQHGEVLRFEPPNVLEWNWGEERFSFELRADGEG